MRHVTVSFFLPIFAGLFLLFLFKRAEIFQNSISRSHCNQKCTETFTPIGDWVLSQYCKRTCNDLPYRIIEPVPWDFCKEKCIEELEHYLNSFLLKHQCKKQCISLIASSKAGSDKKAFMDYIDDVFFAAHSIFRGWYQDSNKIGPHSQDGRDILAEFLVRVTIGFENAKHTESLSTLII